MLIVAKETLINTFQPFFKMSSKAQSRTFLKTAKRTLRFNQRIPNVNVPFEGYIGAQEGGFITGVLVDTGDKKWFIVCNPSL